MFIVYYAKSHEEDQQCNIFARGCVPWLLVGPDMECNVTMQTKTPTILLPVIFR